MAPAAGAAAAAASQATASLSVASIGAMLTKEVLQLVIEAVFKLHVREMALKVLSEYTEPTKILEKITPDELKATLAWKEGGKKRAKYIIDYIKFLRDFNLKFADLSVFASLFGREVGYVASQITNAYQWSYGLGWLSWIGTGQLLQKMVSEPISQDLDYLIRNKLLTESAALELWKKGLIKDEECREALRYQGYSEEKIELLMKKEVVEISGGIFSKLIQLGFIKEEDAIKKFKMFGLDDTQARILYLSCFKEPSLTLLAKGFKSGLIDEHTIRNYLKAMGYDDVSISLILASTKEEKIEKDKELTKSEILTLFRSGLISEVNCRNLLSRLGYDENEITLLINLEKTKIGRGEKSVDKSLSKSEIIKAYVNNVLSRIEAEELLSMLGYDSREISIIMEIAEQSKAKQPIEKKKEIARSDVLKAFRLGIITKEQAVNMLSRLGFTQEDISLILSSAEVAGEEKRTLTASQIISAATRRITTISQTYEYLKSLGYGDFEVSVLFKLNYADKEVLALVDAVKAKRITKEEAARALLDLGFSSSDVSLIFSIYQI